MSKPERETALRLIGKRNQERVEALKKGEEGKEAGEAEK
jgi:hypothetical protein